MLPVRKSANTEYAAKYLRRAERIARSLQGHTLSKRSVMDGCIVEGRKSGNLLSARVIEPPPLMFGYSPAMFMGEGGSRRTATTSIQMPTSAVFRPDTPAVSVPSVESELLNEGRYLGFITVGNPSSDFEINPDGTVRRVYTPLRDSIGATFISNGRLPQSIRHGEIFAYRADRVFDASEISKNYIHVEMINSQEQHNLVINWDEVPADGYGIRLYEEMWGGSADIFVLETGYGEFTLLVTAGQLNKVVVDHDPEGGINYETLQIKTALFRLDVDLRLRENQAKRAQMGGAYDPSFDRILPEITTTRLPDSLFPSDLGYKNITASLSGSAVVTDVTLPTSRAIKILDAYFDAEDLVIALRVDGMLESGTIQQTPVSEAYALYGMNPYEDFVFLPGVFGTRISSTVIVRSSGGLFQSMDTVRTELYSLTLNAASEASEELPTVYPSGLIQLLNQYDRDTVFAEHGDRAFFYKGDLYEFVFDVSRDLSWYPSTTIDVLRGPLFKDDLKYKMLRNGEIFTPSGDACGDIIDYGWPKITGDLPMFYGRSGTAPPFGLGTGSDWLVGSMKDAVFHLSDDTLAYIAAKGIAATDTMINPIYETEFVSRVRSEEIGVAFFDGIRQRFEKLGDIPTPAGEPEDELIFASITCYQTEVRDDSGKLITPSCLIAQVFIHGEPPHIRIRKGPVWPEDMEDGANYEDFWSDPIELSPKDFSYIFYIGNPLSSGTMTRRFK